MKQKKINTAYSQVNQSTNRGNKRIAQQLSTK